MVSQLAANAANTVAKTALQKSLLGKVALGVVPNAGAFTLWCVIQAAPAAGNAVYQGLTQQTTGVLPQSSAASRNSSDSRRVQLTCSK